MSHVDVFVYVHVNVSQELCRDGWCVYFLTKTSLCSAVLAHFILKEKLHIFGVLGCVLCVVGSTSIVLHAPHEKNIESVKEVWQLATEPGIREVIL